ncbi:hypothetical protein AAU61_07335 [Desulfocarbo indianensis]|nr:hypothetical protein AAU61_07335 [Desulfocarbo indianensis]
MSQEPNAEELLKKFEAICREQQYEFEAIYADVRKALALPDGTNHGPTLVALACIAIGVLVGKPYGGQIIKSGFEAVSGEKQEK